MPKYINGNDELQAQITRKSYCIAQERYREGFNDAVMRIKSMIHSAPVVEFYTLEDVAQILADAFGEYCACNFNGNDEWLPQKCAFAETTCPDTPEPLDCWKQYLLNIKEHKL